MWSPATTTPHSLSGSCRAGASSPPDLGGLLEVVDEVSGAWLEQCKKDNIDRKPGLDEICFLFNIANMVP